MSLLPSWPTVVAGLVIGSVAGAWVDHSIMAGRIDKMNAASALQEQQRSVQRAADEKTAREKEQNWADLMGLNEQEHQDEVAKVRAAGAAAIAGVRNRPDRQPTNSSGVRQATTACQGSTGAELSRSDSEFLIGEAARADEQRAALSACYSAYDTIR